MTERWERNLNKLSLLEPPPHLRERIGESQAPRDAARPLQRVAIIITSFSVFLAAGSFAWLALRPAGDANAPLRESQLPDVGRITCGHLGATTPTPRFQVQSDGVHIEAEHTSGFDEVVIVGQGGLLAETQANVDLSQSKAALFRELPPGHVLAGCFTNSQLGGVDYKTLTVRDGMVEMEIEDPEGSYVPSDLECEGAGVDELMPTPASTEASSPEATIRAALLGIQPGDSIERTGYPVFHKQGPGSVSPRYRIVRDGRAIGLASVLESGNLAIVSMLTVCGDSGIVSVP